MQKSCCVVTWGGVSSRTVYDSVHNHSDVSRALSHSFRWLTAYQFEFCTSPRCWKIKRLSLTSVKQKCRREGTTSQPKVAFISSASYTTAERSEGWETWGLCWVSKHRECSRFTLQVSSYLSLPGPWPEKKRRSRLSMQKTLQTVSEDVIIK